MLELKNLNIGYEKIKVAGAISEELHKGELVCLLGPNGTGKSTLVKTISGILDPLSGTIEFNGQQLAKYSNKEKSKIISIVLTEPIVIGNLSVFEIVELGRFPYRNWWGKSTNDDLDIIHEAIFKTGIEHLTKRNIGELSDGEKQKVMIARALAQDTDYIILDEPTSHLDLPSKIEVMTLLKGLVKKWNKSILVSTHDLNLAIQTADKFWLIDKQGGFQSGVNEDLILDGSLNTCFGLNDSMYSFSSGKIKLPKSTHINVQIEGFGNALKWTRHAIERLGFSIVKQGDVLITANKNNTWSFQYKNVSNNVTSIKELIKWLKTIELS